MAASRNLSTWPLVRQACLLFLLAMDWITRRTTVGQISGTQWTLWSQLDDLDFADDITLLSSTHPQMKAKTNLLETTSVKTGFIIDKTKEMHINNISSDSN